MAFNPQQPYNDLPPLPPAVDLETKATLRGAIGANRALAELKGVGELLPNQSILVHAVTLQEARSSSEIEGIVTTDDALYRALSATSDADDDPHAKEVLRYSEALWLGFERMKSNRPLCTGLYEEIVRAIKKNMAGVRKTTGTQLRDVHTGAVIYTPPEGETVLRDKLANLDRYIHADDGVDPLIKLAAIHYQFEAIHPFGDGNGRTGRIVNILYLVTQRLLDLPILFLSRFIIEHKSTYYEHLRRVTEQQAWEPWVLYMLEAVEQTARQSLRQVADIRDLMEDYGQRVRRALPKTHSKELVEQLFDRPYCKIGFLVDAGIAKRQTASRYLQELADAGMLDLVKIGRESIYVNSEFLELLRRPPVDRLDISKKRVEKQ